MENSTAFTAPVLRGWRRRHNLLPALVLIALAAAGWAYVAYRSTSSDSMGHPAMSSTEAGILFLFGWVAMLMAMMVPPTMPLILLYRTIALNQGGPARSRSSTAALVTGYLAVWAITGAPVYAYTLFAGAAGSAATVLPATLLAAAGVYQFTSLKRTCHARCSSPLFFLLQNWRQGAAGALRLGLRHGLDCVGCCAGIMVALAALGMMNLVWMSTAAVVVFFEKTLPGGHRLARPLGAIMIAGGAAFLVSSLP